MPDSPEDPTIKGADPWSFSFNPYAVGTRAYAMWSEMMLRAKEELALSHSEALSGMPPAEAAPAEFLKYFANTYERTFDALARAIFPRSLTDDAANAYEYLLDQLEAHTLALSQKCRVFFIPHAHLVSETKLRVAARKAYWISQSLKTVREKKDRDRATASDADVQVREVKPSKGVEVVVFAPQKSESDQTGSRENKPKVKTPLGGNIDRLRQECGWSYDRLARASGIGKQSILGHVNEGRGANPSTLKIYADTFTRQLGRIVSVAELKS